MNALLILDEARAAGVLLWHESDRVLCRGTRQSVAHFVPRLAAHRRTIAAALQHEADEENFEERAAIMEFDGGLSRADAEIAARLLLKNRSSH